VPCMPGLRNGVFALVTALFIGESIGRVGYMALCRSYRHNGPTPHAGLRAALGTKLR
jgi:hypothetical protein